MKFLQQLPKREIGGISLSMSVPAVLISPSRNAFSMNFRVFAMGIMVLPYEHANIINVNFYLPDQFNLKYYIIRVLFIVHLLYT